MGTCKEQKWGSGTGGGAEMVIKEMLGIVKHAMDSLHSIKNKTEKGHEPLHVAVTW